MKNRITNILAAAALLLVCGLIVRSQVVTAETGDSTFTNVVATGEVVSPVVYDLYNSSTGYGYRLRTFATTLSSGAGSVNYGSGTEAVGCVAYYNQSTIRSFAINTGHVAAQRTISIQLGGGGTTSDAVAGHCWTKEVR